MGYYWQFTGTDFGDAKCSVDKLNGSITDGSENASVSKDGLEDGK